MRNNLYDILIEACVIFLLIFTPLAYGAVVSWAVVIIEVTAAVMALLWVLKMLNAGRFEFIRAPAIFFIFLFIVYVLLQLFSRHPYLTTVYFYATRTELLKVISYALIFFVMLNIVRTRRQITRIVSVIAAMGFIMSVLYLLRYFGASVPRGFINQDHFSAYLNMIIPLTLGLLFTREAPTAEMEGGRIANNNTSHYLLLSAVFSLQGLLLFSVVIMSAALFFTMSRGGMFTFIAGLLLMSVLMLRRKSIRRHRWTIWAVLIFIILTLAWLGATPVIARILSIKAEITSLYFGGRMPIWQGTVQLIRDYWTFGTGLGTFAYVFPEYQPVKKAGKLITNAHSDILEFLSEVGIVGFLILAVLCLVLFSYILRRYFARHNLWVVGLSIGFLASLTSIFLHSFTDFSLHMPANAILLSIILSLFVTVLNYNHEAVPFLFGTHKIKFIFYPLAVVLLSTYIIVSVRPAIAGYYFQRAKIVTRSNDRRLSRSNDRKDSGYYFLKAINVDPANALYHYELGKQLSSGRHLDRAVSEFQNAVNLNPTNSRYHQSLAWAYGQLGRTELAHQEFNKAVALYPNYYYPHYVYAVWTLSNPNNGRIERGVAEFVKAVELKPELKEEALTRYFAIEKRYVKLKTILSDTPENHYLVMRKLLDAGLWQANETDFKADMEKASDKYPYYKAMSDYYAKIKDSEKSLQILRDYLQTDPNCADAHFWIADSLAYIKPVNWNEVFAHYDAALARDPENMFYREWHARHLYFAKRYSEAISELEIVVKKNAWNVDLVRLLGDWYKEAGRYSDAQTMYSQSGEFGQKREK